MADLDKGPTLTQRILTVLSHSPGEPYSPWFLSRILDADPKSISGILSKLLKKGLIQKYRRGPGFPMKGYYCISETIKETELLEKVRDPPRIHNPKIYIQRASVERDGQIYHVRPEDLRRTLEIQIPNATRKGNHYYLDIGDKRHLTIGIHNNGAVEIWLKCGENALHLTEYPLYLLYVKTLIGHDIWNNSSPELQQLEYNEDYRGIRISGMSSISVEDSEKAVIQIYQKHTETVRAEKRYWLQGLNPETLAEEIVRIEKKGDGLVRGAQLSEMVKQISNQRREIAGIRQEMFALTTVLAATLRTQSRAGTPRPDPPIMEPPDPGPFPGYG